MTRQRYRSHTVPSTENASQMADPTDVRRPDAALTESQRSGLNRRPLSRWQGLFRRLARWNNELGSEEHRATGRTAPATRAHTVPVTFPESPADIVYGRPDLALVAWRVLG